MKNIILVLAMIPFSSCVTAGELESSTNQELFRSGFHPRFHPKPYVNPRKVFPVIPAGHFRPTPFHLPQGVTKCLSDKEEVGACFDYIVRSFFTGAECCEAIKKMTEDCETVFGSFHNPFLTDFVKLHCSIVVGSTSPAPSQAPSQPPSHAYSHSPSQAPLHVPSLAPSQAPSHSPLYAPSHASLVAPSAALSPTSLRAPSLNFPSASSPAQGF